MKANKQPVVKNEPIVAAIENIETPLLQKPWYKKEWAYFCLLFLVVTFVWGKLSNNTWDDDAVTRFMNVGAAGIYPHNFIDSWDRPLFSVLFYLPIKFFGRMGVVGFMSILTTLSGYFLYRAMEIKGEKNASIIVIFIVFQTFLFGICRDAMTEPLASFFFSVGIYFYYKKNYTWFAIIGSLLPLARTETVILLPFWGLVLLQAKRYWHILLLGTGLFLWALALFIYSGNIFELFKEVLQSGGSKNRYTRMEVGHHFLKYVYVVGPVIFYFGVLGFFTSLKRIFAEYFIIAQFLVGFLLYVFFSSQMDLGQSGGALRNLVTLAPLAAIICFYGYRFWMNTINMNALATTAPSVSPQTSSKKQSVQNKNVQVKSNEGNFLRKTSIIVYTLVFLLFSWQLFTNKLLLRQMYDETEKDYTLFLYLLATGFLVILCLIKVFKKATPIITFILLALQIAFVLNFESPNSHENNERITVNKMANIIQNTTLKTEKTLTNHSWYNWVTGVNLYDSLKNSRLDSVVVKKAKPGNVIIWDGHYNNKNYGNLQVSFLLADTSLAPLVDIVDSTNGFSTIAFLKLYNDASKTEAVFNELIKNNPENGKIYYYYANYLIINKKNYDGALVNLNKALELDHRLYFAYYLRGFCYLQKNEKDKACSDLLIAVKANNPDAKALYANMGCK